MFRFHLLGGLRIYQNDEPLPLPPFRTHSLLAAILLRPHFHHRFQLTGLLSPDVDEQRGRRRLSDLLYLLRHSIPELPLLFDSESISLAVSNRWLDVEAFLQASRREGLEDWLQALSLYTGDLMAGYCDDWLLEEQENLHLKYVNLAHQVCDALSQRLEYKLALPILEKLIQEEPYDENALRSLMQTYHSLGRRGSALMIYERFHNQVALELKIEPEEITKSLARSIRENVSIESRRSTEQLENTGTEILLIQAQQALEQGEWAVVRTILALLYKRPTEDVSLEVWKLETDLALSTQNYKRAEELLITCEPQQVEFQIRHAELVLRRRKWDEACQVALGALRMAHEQNNIEAEVRALSSLAYGQYESGKCQQALRSLEHAIHLARMCESPAALARALVVMSRVLSLQGQFEPASIHLNELFELARKYRLRSSEAEAYRILAWIDYFKGELLEMIDDFEKSLNIWRDLGLSRQEARLMIELSEACVQIGDSRRALNLLEQAQEILDKVGAMVQSAINRIDRTIALLCYDESLAPDAIQLAREALDIFEANELTGWKATTLVGLGYALWVAGENLLALQALDESFTIHEQLGEVEVLPEIQMHQTIAYIELGDKTSALRSSEQAVLGVARGEVFSEHLAVEVYYVHAAALSVNGNEQQAKIYFERAYEKLLQMATQIEDEASRLALFQRSPITRRLMREVYARGIAPNPDSGEVRGVIMDKEKHPIEIHWILDAGPADQALKQARGAVALRRARLERLIKEARRQGTTPTYTQLADFLGVSGRTIQRDLAFFRESKTTFR